MIDFDALVLSPNQNVFSKPIIINPLVSQPGIAPYAARGIWTVRHVEAITDSGDILTTRQLTIDIRLSEFAVPPQQNDRITIKQRTVDQHTILYVRGFSVQILVGCVKVPDWRDSR
jgi:hypothetical protein